MQTRLDGNKRLFALQVGICFGEQKLSTESKNWKKRTVVSFQFRQEDDMLGPSRCQEKMGKNGVDLLIEKFADNAWNVVERVCDLEPPVTFLDSEITI